MKDVFNEIEEDEKDLRDDDLFETDDMVDVSNINQINIENDEEVDEEIDTV